MSFQSFFEHWEFLESNCGKLWQTVAKLRQTVSNFVKLCQIVSNCVILDIFRKIGLLLVFKGVVSFIFYEFCLFSKSSTLIWKELRENLPECLGNPKEIFFITEAYVTT